MLPWIYLGYNTEFGGTVGSAPGSTSAYNQSQSQAAQNSMNDLTLDKTKKPSVSINSSKIGGYPGDLLGTSTNVNKSQLGGGKTNKEDMNQQYSNMNDSGEPQDIENDFGYGTDEDSIFYEFTNDEDKPINRLDKRILESNELKETANEVKSVVKRYSEQKKTYEFLVRFNVILEDPNNSSVASAANANLNPKSVLGEDGRYINSKSVVPSTVIEEK